MEIQQEQDCWLIVCGGTTIKKLPREGEVNKIGMANYEQRIFYEECDNDCYNFYYFDDINRKILKLYSSILKLAKFYPKLGYVYHEDDDMVRVDCVNIHGFSSKFTKNLKYMKSIKVTKNYLCCDVKPCYTIVHNMNTNESRALFNTGQFFLTDEEVCCYLIDNKPTFISLDNVLKDRYDIILQLNNENSAASDGTITILSPDGQRSYKRVNKDGKLIDWTPEEFIFQFSGRYMLGLEKILDTIPMPKVLTNIIKLYF